MQGQQPKSKEGIAAAGLVCKVRRCIVGVVPSWEVLVHGSTGGQSYPSPRICSPCAFPLLGRRRLTLRDVLSLLFSRLPSLPPSPTLVKIPTHGSDIKVRASIFITPKSQCVGSAWRWVQVEQSPNISTWRLLMHNRGGCSPESDPVSISATFHPSSASGIA